MGEFDLIRRFFSRPAQRSPLGVGDDCALLAPAPGMQLAVSSDMLVEGRHFLPTVAPDALGHKALAVNLSDLAACGARPLAFTLALALPRADEAWLEGFAHGLLALADAHGCELVGGDTTQGPLNLCITVFGEVPAGGALLRSGARAGDQLWLSGHVGDARLALEAFRGRVSLPQAVFEVARQRMERPTPRVALGQALRGIATSAIDISDGLLGDLDHVLASSGVGATLAIETIAQQALFMRVGTAFGDATDEKAPWREPGFVREMTLAGGDDYELLFTAPAPAAAAVRAAAQASDTPVACIGRIDAEPGLRLLDAQGRPVDGRFESFDHFRS